MDITTLTQAQWEIISYLGLDKEDILEIHSFNEDGMPMDEYGCIILGDGCYELPEEYAKDPGYYKRNRRAEIEEQEKDMLDTEEQELAEHFRSYYGYGWQDDKKPDPLEDKTWRGHSTSDSVASSLVPLVPYKECHTGTKPVFTVDGITFYGAGSSRDGKYWDSAVALDLADVVKPTVRLFGVSLPELNGISAPQIIKLAWRDFDVPDLDKDFWLGLISGLKRICQEKGGTLDVIVCCMGGHGRTGTALSILAGLLGVVPKDTCPVAYIREKYCEKAVEASSQLKYIEKITGLLVTSESSKVYTWSNYSTGTSTPTTEKKEDKK